MKKLKSIYSLSLIIIFFTVVLNLDNKEESTFVNADYKYVYYNGDEEENFIYLTFDNGYSRENTIEILDILNDNDVVATFFFDINFINNNQDLVIKAVNEGHIIGNYAYSCKSNSQFLTEVERYENLYYEITSKQISKIYRPPLGIFNKKNTSILENKEYYLFYWSVAYPNYDLQYDYGDDYTYSQIINRTKNGSIILMHTVLNSSIEALPNIISELKKRGHSFATLEQLTLL